MSDTSATGCCLSRGRGLATRVVRLVSEWAVANLGITRLRLLTDSANESSQGVAERSGFRRVAILPRSDELDGRSIDQVLFELPRAAERHVLMPGPRRAGLLTLGRRSSGQLRRHGREWPP